MKEIHIERTNLKNVRDNIVKDYDRQQNIKKDHTKQKKQRDFFIKYKYIYIYIDKCIC